MKRYFLIFLAGFGLGALFLGCLGRETTQKLLGCGGSSLSLTAKLSSNYGLKVDPDQLSTAFDCDDVSAMTIGAMKYSKSEKAGVVDVKAIVDDNSVVFKQTIVPIPEGHPQQEELRVIASFRNSENETILVGEDKPTAQEAVDSLEARCQFLKTKIAGQ